MGWLPAQLGTRDLDIERARSLLTELDTEYVLVDRSPDAAAESPDLFWDAFEEHSEWFPKMDQWGDVAVFQVVY